MAGGHSVDDLEPKYGLAVTGIVNPNRILRNNTIRAGDALILTKPLGTGVLFNACRDKKISWENLLELLPSIAMLNKKAIEVALDFDISACTDVTGFGLAGHVLEMASNFCVEIEFKKLPFYSGALDMYKKGQKTGSNKANRMNVGEKIKFKTRLSHVEQELLFDPQTSGGLLISVAEGQADDLVKKLHAFGVDSALVIGNVMTSNDLIRLKII
jgi:selenide,water dikinase